MNPSNRREAYLAAMAGADVSIPEPVTREEAYLAGIAENGGSVSWNDIEDRPFYEEELGRAPLIDETTFTVSGGAAYSAVSAADGVDFWKYVGSNLIVTFDGVEYEAACTKDSDEIYWLTFDVNGVTARVEDCSTVYFAQDGEHTIKAEVVDSVVQTLHRKYLPDLPSHTHDPSVDLSTVVPVNKGGTGQNTVAKARTAMGLGFCTCSSPSGNDAKTVSLSGFTKETGVLLAVKFTNANTASNPTLDINSTGAKSIYNFKTNAVVESGDMGACLHLFMYFSNHWVLLNPIT